MLGSAKCRAERAVQDCHFLDAIEPVDAKAAPAGIDISRRPDIAAHHIATTTAAGALRAVVMRVVMVMLMVVVVVVARHPGTPASLSRTEDRTFSN
ncbi:hypothetical protein GCM10008024_29400 [Allgaiera indica]|uniref:Uncharacterized protein n=1 Tax=Allgaiera indica TaxID=765699 RepID=A0AAN5A1A1_9RHOB|nr:hypothetical protein GCM10008024_29400 [Allgaiera indica]